MTDKELINELKHIAFIVDRLGDIRKATIIKTAVSLIEKLTAEHDKAIRDRSDSTAERCVVCGAIIPEGRQICPGCMRGGDVE